MNRRVSLEWLLQIGLFFSNDGGLRILAGLVLFLLLDEVLAVLGEKAHEDVILLRKAFGVDVKQYFLIWREH